MSRVLGFMTLNSANLSIQADPTEFAASTYWQYAVDFDLLGGSTLYVALSGAGRPGSGGQTGIQVRVRVGGTSGVADGTAVVSTTYDAASQFVDYPLSASGTMAMPTGVQLVKISQVNPSGVSAVFRYFVIYLEGRA